MRPKMTMPEMKYSSTMVHGEQFNPQTGILYKFRADLKYRSLTITKSNDLGMSTTHLYQDIDFSGLANFFSEAAKQQSISETVDALKGISHYDSCEDFRRY